MANTKKKEPNDYAFDRFGSDDRATDARSMGLRDIRPPRKNRKAPPAPKPKRK